MVSCRSRKDSLSDGRQGLVSISLWIGVNFSPTCSILDFWQSMTALIISLEYWKTISLGSLTSHLSPLTSQSSCPRFLRLHGYLGSQEFLTDSGRVEELVVLAVSASVSQSTPVRYCWISLMSSYFSFFLISSAASNLSPTIDIN